MSVEVLGRRLVKEVEGSGEGFRELLSALRSLHDPGAVTQHFGIPVLDNWIAESSRSTPLNPETGQTQPSQFNTQSDVLEIPKSTAPPVIALSSTTPDAGVSHLLYLISSIAVLPSSLHGMNISGKESAIIIIDAELSFDVKRCARVMLQWIREKLQSSQALHTTDVEMQDVVNESVATNPISHSASDQDLRTLIWESLSHIHLIRPSSSLSLVTTLQNLVSYLSNPAAHNSYTRPIHSIIFDSLASFRYESSQSQPATHATPIPPSSSPPHKTIPLLLQDISSLLQAPIITTNTALSLSPYRAIPPRIDLAADIRIGVQRVTRKPGFGARVSWEEVWEIEEKRRNMSEAIDTEKGDMFKCWVVGRKGVMSGGSEDHSFGFRILEGGVEILDTMDA